MIVAIPSKGRAGKIKSQKIIPSALLYVPENEVEGYKQTGGKNVVAVPNDVRGITKTRNWILDNTEDPWVVMIDDDVMTHGWIKLFTFRTTKIPLDEKEWLGEWRKLFELTEDRGYRIWGVATDGAPQSVYPWKPFLWRTYITASCMGILNDGRTRFDENFPVKEDYELCLRCIKEDGGIVGARYIHWRNDHWKSAGGCKDYRTQEMELMAIRRLMRLYPGMIRKITRGGSEFSIELDF